MTTYTNNIMSTASGDAILLPADDSCSYFYNLMSSQTQLPARSYMPKTGDPQFVDRQGGDFHLMVGSPAIDAGTPVPTIVHDFDGNVRSQGALTDVGAYEYIP